MKYDINNFKIDLIDLIALCKKELQKRKEGTEGQGTVEELDKYIIPKFEEMLDYANRGIAYSKYPNKTIGASRQVIDSWDYQAELSIKIMQLQNNFRKLK